MFKDEKCELDRVRGGIDTRVMENGDLEIFFTRSVSGCVPEWREKITKARKNNLDQFGRDVVEVEANVLEALHKDQILLIPNELVGARVNSPILAKDVKLYKNKGLKIDDENVWIYRNYDEQDPMVELINKGRVIFNKIKRVNNK